MKDEDVVQSAYEDQLRKLFATYMLDPSPDSLQRFLAGHNLARQSRDVVIRAIQQEQSAS